MKAFNKHIVLLLFFCFAAGPGLFAQSPIESLFAQYFKALQQNKSKALVKQLLKTDLSWQQCADSLQQMHWHRPPDANVLAITSLVSKTKMYAYIILPRNYDTARQYPLLVHLHGGIHTPFNEAYQRRLNHQFFRTHYANYIVLYPVAWRTAKWWDFNQSKHIQLLLRQTRLLCNINEQRIYLQGVSDGGTGSWFQSHLTPGVYAAHLNLIGSLEDLRWNVFHPVSIVNYQNLNFYSINTQNDPIFPPHIIQPYNTMLRQQGIQLKSQMVDSLGHNMHWFPRYADSIRQYLASQQNNFFPDSISFERFQLGPFNRKYWLVVNAFDSAKYIRHFPDYNFVRYRDSHIRAFSRQHKPFTIHLKKQGNTVYLQSSHSACITLLLNPAHFNFNAPVRIYHNGKFHSEHQPQLKRKVLFRYFEQFINRQFLIADELELRL